MLNKILAKKKRGEKMMAVLLDPDSYQDTKKLIEVTDLCNLNAVDLIFIGGSLVTSSAFDAFVADVKEFATQPVILFPGDNTQLSANADALLMLSLISGRNPEYLIGQHVKASVKIKRLGLETIPTGYMLIDGGSNTSVSYISQTIPIPRDKSDIAISTALAGEQLGMQLIYLDCGSGAQLTVEDRMLTELKQHITVPIVVGGGVKDIKQLKSLLDTGADIVVIGNIFEKNPGRIEEFGRLTKSYSSHEVGNSIIKEKDRR
ncbi:MAG: geranylgeranylglyceryl/heptaprenylglyceryl phosphate synthase [Flavobacteriales bacterium]|nr:geranylgeranylglyceryl/heptaprenylglyceryl phosphate synthase [Flavobacteriales bacterium]